MIILTWRGYFISLEMEITSKPQKKNTAAFWSAIMLLLLRLCVLFFAPLSVVNAFLIATGGWISMFASLNMLSYFFFVRFIQSCCFRRLSWWHRPRHAFAVTPCPLPPWHIPWNKIQPEFSAYYKHLVNLGILNVFFRVLVSAFHLYSTYYIEVWSPGVAYHFCWRGRKTQTHDTPVFIKEKGVWKLRPSVSFHQPVTTPLHFTFT